MNKLIINAAITGMVPQRADSKYVPLTPAEIAADAKRCFDAGASIVHLHARDESGAPTSDASVYQEILERTHEAAPELILCVSTSGRLQPDFASRSAILHVTDPGPEMASLTLGSLNFPKSASVTSPEMIEALAQCMAERGITPELECFEIGMVELISYLVRKDILRAPIYCNLLLGSRGTITATETNLKAMVEALPKGAIWAAAGIGRFQYSMNSLAIELGGHVRVGLEDNLWFDEQHTQLASNPALIERVVLQARTCGRAIASPAEARKIIGLPFPTLASSPTKPSVTAWT